MAPPNLYGAHPNFAAPPAEASTEVLYAMRWGRRVYASWGPSTEFRAPDGTIDLALLMSQAALSHAPLPAAYLELAGPDANSVLVVRDLKNGQDRVFRFRQQTFQESGLVTLSTRPWRRGHEILEYVPARRPPTATIIYLGGNDGGTARQVLAVWASNGVRVLSLPWVQAGTLTPGCIDRVDLDVIETRVRDLVEEFGPKGEVALVGFSGGGDAALMIASRMPDDFASVHAISSAVWHFNGSRGPGCMIASSPWSTQGRPVPWVLNFPLRWTTPVALMRRTAGSLSQNTLAVEALEDVPDARRDAVRFHVSDVRYPVYLYAGGLDDLIPAAASLELLCAEVATAQCYVNPRAGHNLVGPPASPAYCRSPEEALHGTDRRSYCLETARARRFVFNTVLRSLGAGGAAG
jgi:pimeloyl-ACP methyl ester carboxylesterase